MKIDAGAGGVGVGGQTKSRKERSGGEEGTRD